MKTKINILTNNLSPNSRAFNFPLILFKNKISINYNLKLFFNDSILSKETTLNKRMLDCDILGINAKSVHLLWTSNRKYLFDFLLKAKGQGIKILWFDTYDSTVSTEFEVLSYVDVYLKNQLLKDKTLYLQKESRTRFFINHLNKLYDINQYSDTDWELPDEYSLEKIQLSWNSCFENYTKSRYRFFSKVNQKYLRPNHLWPQKNHIEFFPVNSDREIKCSYRGTTNYRWAAIAKHRQEISRLLNFIGVESEKIKLDLFFHEMQNSVASVGPFGLGEITLRDYEIIISGSTLIKPDISYIETWPNLFKKKQTYVPIKWDLSDLLETVEMLNENSNLRKEIATKAQDEYKKYLIEDHASQLFVDHFDKIINYVS